MPPRLDRPAIYAATNQWLDVLTEGDSLFTSGKPVWTTPALDELYERVVAKTISGKRGQSSYGVGVVWGRGIAPVATQEVMLCTIDRLPEAVGAILEN